MRNDVRRRAIRGAWAVARASGIEPKAKDWPVTGQMSKDDQLRKAMVQAWLAGYRNGRDDSKWRPLS